MPRFRRKVTFVVAEQFFPDQPLPPGVHPASVQEYAPQPYVITAHGQRVYVEAGDWIIPEPNESGYYPCKDVIFRDTYEPAESA